MITKIGIVAGEIWQCLDSKGELSLDDLINHIKREREIVLMSVGWLAREGHVILERSETDYKIRLRKNG